MPARARTGLVILVWVLCGLALLGLHFLIVIGSAITTLTWPAARHVRMQNRTS